MKVTTLRDDDDDDEYREIYLFFSHAHSQDKINENYFIVDSGAVVCHHSNMMDILCMLLISKHLASYVIFSNNVRIQDESFS